MMLTPELLRQFRRLHWQARRLVQTLLEGQYHSVFRGTGLAFEEVRAYQPGDDVRLIDWNVTARMGQPFLKRYVEERELTVLLVADISASMGFGSGLRSKRRVMGELAAMMILSAMSNNDRVGLLAGSQQVEQFLPPSKGSRHALRMLRDVLFLEPSLPGTSLRHLLDTLNRVQRRRAIVFLMSDFLDEGFAVPFRLAGGFHDLIALRLVDPCEEELPDAGLLWLEDAENGRQQLIDTHRPDVRTAFRRDALARADTLRKLARGCQVDLVEVSTRGNHAEALVHFFRRRQSRWRQG